MSEVCPSHDPTPLLAAREGEEMTRPALRVVRPQERPRRLLLCLDGVPFEVIREAKSRGMFDNFREPACLLSPFPTLTNVALAEMLGATPPNGYESLYFDREARELRGGVRKYIGRRTPDKVPSSYMDELDYQEPLAFEFLIYVATEAVWRADMRRFRERFLSAPPSRDFFGFLKATDGLLHIGGPARLAVALQSLDRLLGEIQRAAGSETEVVLFSDHGMNLVENRRLHLQSHLARNGYEVVSHMRRPRGRRRVSAPGFGLCGYAALYCGEETDGGELAESLRELEGVDFSVYREGEAAAVKGAAGSARIHRAEREGETFYRYERLDGDPLGLAHAVLSLGVEGRLDGAGFGRDADWLARTWGHTYPDALANVYGSVFTPRVRHTADVLVSLRDGYYYGATSFSRMVRLLATHGNALRSSSHAFLMSTHRAFDTHVRSTEACPVLRGSVGATKWCRRCTVSHPAARQLRKKPSPPYLLPGARALLDCGAETAVSFTPRKTRRPLAVQARAPRVEILSPERRKEKPPMKRLALALALSALPLAFAPPGTPAPQTRPRVVGIKEEAIPVGEDDVVKTEVDLVVLDALVLQKKTGRVVGDLTREDFTLAEDGVPQQITHFSQNSLPLSVLLLIDRGGCLDPFSETVKRAATDSVARLKPADEVALMSYHDTVELVEGFTRDRGRVADALGRVPGHEEHGQHCLDRAFYEAARYMARAGNPVGRRVIVVVTAVTSAFACEGGPSVGEAKREVYESGSVVCGLIPRTAGQRIESGVYRAMTGVGGVFKVPSLNVKHLAEETGGEVLTDKPEHLDRTFDTLFEHLRTRYQLAYAPTNRKHDGTVRKLKLKLKPAAEKPRGKLAVKTRRSYVAPKS